VLEAQLSFLWNRFPRTRALDGAQVAP
jgi:hypothetical protein